MGVRLAARPEGRQETVRGPRGRDLDPPRSAEPPPTGANLTLYAQAMTTPILFWLAVALAALSAVTVARKHLKASSRSALIAALAVPISASALFFTLALHMHRSLGGWPETIGNRGFPEGLLQHESAAFTAFGILLIGLLLSPLALLLCAAAPRLRGGLSPIAIYAAASIAALLLTNLAPDPFLYWWWD